MIRTTSPVYPEEPYDWKAQSKGQCTGYAFGRVQEMGLTPPCYGDRKTKTGSYANAKYWLDNFREPGVIKDTNYTPVAGDIAVFTGTYGHVVVIERVASNIALISECNNKVKLGFDTMSWKVGSTISGCGPLIGYLHYEEPESDKLKELKKENEELKSIIKEIRRILG